MNTKMKAATISKIQKVTKKGGQRDKKIIKTILKKGKKAVKNCKIKK